jgi:hypothetical protein
MPSMTPRNRTSAKMMATSRRPISRVASVASGAPRSGNGVQRRPRRSIGLDGSVALAPCLGSPERSSRSAFNRRTSGARRLGSGVEMTSAKAVRNPPASINGNFIRSKGRRIATVLRQRTFPARSCVHPIKCASGGFVRPDPPNGSFVNCAITFGTPRRGAALLHRTNSTSRRRADGQKTEDA